MKPLLIIDNGHGGKDVGGGCNEYYKEKDVTLKMGLYQYVRFKELGVLAEITRDTDIYLSPADRTKIIRDSGVRFCISNHINAAVPSARGVETIHSINSSSKLAKMLYDAITQSVPGTAGRRVFSKESTKTKGIDYYFMHRDTGAVQTVIVEYGFATNEKDAVLIRDNWQTYAEAVVKAFCEYIGHPYTPPRIQNDLYPEGTPKWKKDLMDWLYDEKLLNDDEWKKKVDEPLPAWAVASILKQMKVRG